MLVSQRSSKLLGVLSILLIQCGGRSGILSDDAGVAPIPCKQDGDCVDSNQCITQACVNSYCATVARKDCDDQVFCTSDSCDESSGECVHQWKTNDNDNDGYYAPLPGTTPGAPDSCGDDCNDTMASAHPQAPELCDGFDNNCDGRVDEGSLGYRTASGAVRVTDESFVRAGPKGLAYNGSFFGVSFSGSTSSETYQGYFSGYDALASNVVSAINITQTSTDSEGGPLIWTGAVFATAWEVRGERGYDIRFNELDARGQKMGPDLLVSRGAGFSVHPTLLWDGSQYFVAWSDDNNVSAFRIFGRKISSQREMSGDTLELTDVQSDARTPLLVKSPCSNLLLFFSFTTQQICGRMFKSDMTPTGGEFCLSAQGAGNYSAAWVNDRFVIAWSLDGELPGNAIWATTIDAQGNVTQGRRSITSGANFARTPSVVALGDRFALAWTDDRVTYAHYGVRLSTYGLDLAPLTTVQTLAETTYDCIDPTLASGGLGLALIYRERTDTKTGFPYFVGLTCEYGLQ
jgi:hypothetical protein